MEHVAERRREARAVDVRHGHVEDRQVGLEARSFLEGAIGVLERGHAIPVPGQHALESPQAQRIVVHAEDDGTRRVEAS